MGMKPRGARCGGHKHDDGPYEAVKHVLNQASQMPVCRTVDQRAIQRIRELQRLLLRVVGNKVVNQSFAAVRESA